MFITQGKTNWKYLLLVFILAVIAAGGILLVINFIGPGEMVDDTPEQTNRQPRGR